MEVDDHPRAFALNADGSRLFIGLNDGTLLVRDTESLEVLASAKEHERAITRLALDATRGRIVSASDDETIRIWDAEALTVIHSIPFADQVGKMGSLPVRLALSPDGALLAHASGESVHLRDTTSGELLRVLEGHRAFVSSIAFKYMELFGNFGSNGTIFVDGVSLTGGRNFEGRPSNSHDPDTTFTQETWVVNREASVIELRVVDITDESEIFIDDLRVE